MSDRYIWHITLTTGDTRRSWRHEIDPALMPQISALLDTAIAAEAAHVYGPDIDRPTPRTPLPVPGYTMSVTPQGRCLLGTVYAGESVPLATFGVAAHARCGAGLWRAMTEVPEPIPDAPERPQAPWCAVILRPALALHMDAAHWLGDLERCMAWAWLDLVRQRHV